MLRAGSISEATSQASIVAAFYQKLLKEGFSAESAIRLTIAWIAEKESPGV